MDQLYFSDASLDDLDKIVAIYNSTISSRMVTADLEPVSVESRIAWFHEHQLGKRPLWTVKNKEEVIGWVSFQNFYGRPAYNATAEISIYLHPLQRGKGLGKLVLDHSMNECKNLGIKTLLGYIFAHNAPSLGLFLKAGFTEWAHLPDIANLDGIERSVKILGKRIYR
jgi:L-amino acid N-acyltransferase YncA